MQRIRIGTRGSKLALVQTNQVVEQLRKAYPEIETETVVLRTKGDQILDRPLIDFGGKGVFITEFEEALLNGKIDLAVHSSKDMPMHLEEGLTIAGTLARADARDVLVMRKGIHPRQQKQTAEKTIEQIRQDNSNILIGTGSLRRQFQLKSIYPGISCLNIRGNVQTRLNRILEGQCDGVILAAAGLERLGLTKQEEFDSRYFSFAEMIPAGGQGIIAVEGRSGDPATELVRGISDQIAYQELETERRVLQLLDAGCHEAVGVISQIQDDRISLEVIQEKRGVIYRRRGEDTVTNRMKLADAVVSAILK